VAELQTAGRDGVGAQRVGPAGQDQGVVIAFVAQDGGPEGVQPFRRGGVGAQGWRTREEGGLELHLLVVQERDQETGPVAEAPEDGALADPRGGGHRLHGQVRRSALGHQPGGRVQQAGAIACGVRP
jgi:hypothetical protein